MPLAAHGLAAGWKPLRMQQHPIAPARRARALAGIVLGQTPRDVVGPADIGQVAIFCESAEDVDEAVHALRGNDQRPEKRLSNEPTGTTGCAPASKPLLLAGGAAEYAVR